ncbi:hypothetical protein Gorai_006301 [Gossypium raimondii]|uniref:Uncharacterized protein n=1 Tax=Gossypium raimondii TaxID=29730 RepID=A0A7J8QFP0_GOSRA|nr:hypothetical protein [Gossypium raimondii]
MLLLSQLFQSFSSEQKPLVLHMGKQVVVRRSRCNHYLSELHKTLLDSCISQFTAIRDLNCGLAILRYMVENSSTF